jgi:hypothetical protein
MMLLVLALAASQGRPLFYWGSRPATVTAEASASPGDEAQVTEVHAALDKGGPVVRFTFDRSVAEAVRLPDGSPVSGRLRAVLYLDADDDRTTGLDQGSRDLRTGADLRLEIGTVTVGADPEEKRAAVSVITTTLASLAADGRRRTLWRADDAAAAASVSAHGEWLEVRLPIEHARLVPRARLILSAGDRSWDGRIAP